MTDDELDDFIRRIPEQTPEQERETLHGYFAVLSRDEIVDLRNNYAARFPPSADRTRFLQIIDEYLLAKYPDKHPSFPAIDSFLVTARRDFAGFYRIATPRDTTLMDGLVGTHAGLVVGINMPRKHLDPESRALLERECDKTERVFTTLREAVRACPTFKALSVGEQLMIERVIFDVRPPWFG